MTKVGKVLSFFGAVNVEREKVRLLHPLGLLSLPFWVALAVVVCLFTDESVHSSFQGNYCAW